MKRLTKEFFERDTETVARELLGKIIIRKIDGKTQIAKIVETEAYLGEHDLAAHSSKGITQRNDAMFGPAGRAYVYIIYGIHNCLNFVTGQPGEGTAVLIRAVEPLKSINSKTMGLGLLCNALQIDRSLNKYNMLTGNSLYVCENEEKDTFDIVKSARIGVDYAGDWAKKPLRFYVKDNKYVSKR